MNTCLSLARLGTVAARVGAVIFTASSLLHPSAGAPSDLPAALADYASSPQWMWIHFGQFAGVAGEGVALVALAANLNAARRRPGHALPDRGRNKRRGISRGTGRSRCRKSHDGTSVGGRHWRRSSACETAFAVRQIEIGFTSPLRFLVGSTLTVFCLAMLPSARYPAWLGGIGLLGGLGTVAVVYWINVSWKNR